MNGTSSQNVANPSHDAQTLAPLAVVVVGHVAGRVEAPDPRDPCRHDHGQAVEVVGDVVEALLAEVVRQRRRLEPELAQRLGVYAPQSWIAQSPVPLP